MAEYEFAAHVSEYLNTVVQGRTRVECHWSLRLDNNHVPSNWICVNDGADEHDPLI